MLQMMPPPLSFFFFSSSRLSPTATAGFRDEWWVDSLFLLLWLPRRDFCSLFLLLWLSLGISAGFPAKRDLLEKILENWNLKLRDLNPQSSSLFTIEKFLPVPGIEPGSALPIMSLLHLLQSSIDAVMKLDNSSSRWGEQALSLEVPCQGSWCRCQTYPTWAPRGRLPS